MSVLSLEFINVVLKDSRNYFVVHSMSIEVVKSIIDIIAPYVRLLCFATIALVTHSCMYMCTFPNFLKSSKLIPLFGLYF